MDVLYLCLPTFSLHINTTTVEPVHYDQILRPPAIFGHDLGPVHPE